MLSHQLEQNRIDGEKTIIQVQSTQSRCLKCKFSWKIISPHSFPRACYVCPLISRVLFVLYPEFFSSNFMIFMAKIINFWVNRWKTCLFFPNMKKNLRTFNISSLETPLWQCQITLKINCFPISAEALRKLFIIFNWQRIVNKVKSVYR